MTFKEAIVKLRKENIGRVWTLSGFGGTLAIAIEPDGSLKCEAGVITDDHLENYKWAWCPF